MTLRDIATRLLLAGLLAGWFLTPASVIFVGALPIADDLRAFWLPPILLYVVWPVVALASLICTILFGVMRMRLKAILASLIFASIVICVVSEWKSRSLDPLVDANDLLHFVTVKAAYDRTQFRVEFLS